MSAEMAKNISRTAAYADSMAATVDKLVMASTREDWDEIGAVSQQLVDEARKNLRRRMAKLDGQAAHRGIPHAHQRA